MLSAGMAFLFVKEAGTADGGRHIFLPPHLAIFRGLSRARPDKKDGSGSFHAC